MDREPTPETADIRRDDVERVLTALGLEPEEQAQLMSLYMPRADDPEFWVLVGRAETGDPRQASTQEIRTTMPTADHEEIVTMLFQRSMDAGLNPEEVLADLGILESATDQDPGE
jgi:hypothetical protein